MDGNHARNETTYQEDEASGTVLNVTSLTCEVYGDIDELTSRRSDKNG